MQHRRLKLSGFDPDLLPAIAVGILSFALYYITSATDITWAHESQDSGDLAACAAILGIPHPTGYPLYILLGHLLTRILFWIEPGRAMVLLSVISASVAVGVIARACALSIRLLFDRGKFSDSAAGWWGALGSVFAAVSPLLWSQAVVCEVYSFAVLLQSIAWLYLVRFLLHNEASQVGKAEKSLVFIGFTFGLILAHHLTGAAIILPVAVILLFSRVRLSLSVWIKTLAAIIPGLLFYLYLPIRSLQNPSLDWGNPETPAAVWRHVTAWQYRNLAFGVQWSEFVRRIESTGWIENWGYLAIILLLIGLVALARKNRRATRAGASAILFYSIWVAAFAYGYNVSDYEIFLYPLLPVFSIAIAVGLAAVAILLRHLWSGLPWILALAVLINVAGGVNTLYPEMDCSGSLCKSAVNFAWRKMSTMPEDSLVIAGSDGTLFSLLYAANCGISNPSTGERLEARADIDIVATTWIMNDWFVRNVHDRYGTNGKIIAPEPSGNLATTLEAFIDANLPQRPVFVDGNALRVLQIEDTNYELIPESGLIRIMPAE